MSGPGLSAARQRELERRMEELGLREQDLEERFVLGGGDLGVVEHERADRGHACTAGCIEPVDSRIRVPDRNTGFGEHGSGRALAHADRACQSDDHRAFHAERTALRSSSSTSGRRPNHRSNPGTA